MDGEQTELLRDTPRFRINSREGAEAFRLRKSFLGTSRMTYRASVLREIGRVPETLRFQADEYLFTLAGLFADVLILRESLTFYRLHDANLFQFSDGNVEAIRRKGQVLGGAGAGTARRIAAPSGRALRSRKSLWIGCRTKQINFCCWRMVGCHGRQSKPNCRTIE